MRRGRLALTGAMWMAISSAWFAACGGSDSGDDTGDAGGDASVTPDTSTSDVAQPPQDSGGGISATGKDLNLYLGQIAQVEAPDVQGASGETPTYTWTLEAKPAGSAIAQAQILGAATATPSFTPDVKGAYVLKVVVTTSAGTAATNVNVVAHAAEIFYSDVTADGGADATTFFGVVGSDGEDASAVTCAMEKSPVGAGAIANIAKVGADIWEGPPGTPARLAFVFDRQMADGGTSTYLAAATRANNCKAPPRELDEMIGEINFSDSPILQPSFSPNGNRIAYIRDTPTGAHIASIGFDGSAPHKSVAGVIAEADGATSTDAGLGGQSGFRPRWRDDTHIDWLQRLPGGGWQIVEATDADGQTPTLIMTCKLGVRPIQYDILPDGSVLVADRFALADGAPAPQDLVLLTPNAATKECEVVRSVGKMPDRPGAFVSEFRISPDRQRVAFLASGYEFDGAPTSIYTANIAVDNPPSKLPGTPDGGSLESPRFLAGGAMISWGLQGTFLGGDASTASIAVVPAGGGTPTAVKERTTPNNTLFAIGDGSWIGCGFANAGGSGVAAIFGAGGLAGLIARRRRKNR